MTLLAGNVICSASERIIALRRIIRHFVLKSSLYRGYVIARVVFSRRTNCACALVKLGSLQGFHARFVFSRRRSTDKFFTSLTCPAFLTTRRIRRIVTHTTTTRGRHHRRTTVTRQHLRHKTLIMSCSTGTLTVFASRPSSILILRHVGTGHGSDLACRNHGITN